MLIGQGFNVVPVQIYSEFVGEMGGNASFAASLATVLVAITFVLFAVQGFILKRKSFLMNGLKPMPSRPLKGWRSLVVHSFCHILLFFSLLPQLVVIITSFLKSEGGRFIAQFSFESYARVFNRMSNTIINSFGFALIGSFIIIILSLFIAYLTVRRPSPVTRLIDVLTMLPYVIPGSVVGIALLSSFNAKPILLSGTISIMILSFVLRNMPYTLRASSAILYQISPSIEEAAISLGASAPRLFFSIIFFVMLPGLFAGALLSYVNILNELSSSILLFTNQSRTLAVAIYGEVNQGGYGTAAALSTILTLITTLSLIIFNKISKNKDLSF
jgi:iron(III) transport system permease protein